MYRDVTPVIGPGFLMTEQIFKLYISLSSYCPYVASYVTDDYVRYAFGLTSDYLKDTWSEKLKQSLK